ANPGLGGEVDDEVRAERVDRRVEALAVLEQALGGAELAVLQQHGMTAALERHVVIVGHAVIAVHEEAFLEQQPGEVKSDESGRAGDEYAPQINDPLFAGAAARPSRGDRSSVPAPQYSSIPGPALPQPAVMRPAASRSSAASCGRRSTMR